MTVRRHGCAAARLLGDTKGLLIRRRLFGSARTAAAWAASERGLPAEANRHSPNSDANRYSESEHRIILTWGRRILDRGECIGRIGDHIIGAVEG
jgi:hypothetical protein